MGKIIIGAVIVVAIITFFGFRGKDATAPASLPAQTQTNQSTAANYSDVKEFSMTSYYNDEGKWFSLKEINVKKGDTVRIKITNIKGTHDFNIDEYSIKRMTPLNEETVIEFIADKVGEFAYYCSVPGHRAAGQFGILKVTQ